MIHEAVLVDPGDDAAQILKEIAAIENSMGARIKIKALLHTHAHFDHISATRAIKEHFIARNSSSDSETIPQIFLHPTDELMYNMLPQQAQLFGFQSDSPLPVDQFFKDEQTLSFGTLKFTFLHTPGHSPGDVFSAP